MTTADTADTARTAAISAAITAAEEFEFDVTVIFVGSDEDVLGECVALGDSWSLWLHESWVEEDEGWWPLVGHHARERRGTIVID